MIRNILKKLKTKKREYSEEKSSLFFTKSRLLLLVSICLMVLSSMQLAYQILTNINKSRNLKYCTNADFFIYEGSSVGKQALSYNENKLLGCFSLNKIDDNTYKLVIVNNNTWNIKYNHEYDFECTTLIGKAKIPLDMGCNKVPKIWQCSQENKNVLVCETNKRPVNKIYKKDSTIITQIVPSYYDLSYARKIQDFPLYSGVLDSLDNIYKDTTFEKVTVGPVLVRTKEKLEDEI